MLAAHQDSAPHPSVIPRPPPPAPSYSPAHECSLDEPVYYLVRRSEYLAYRDLVDRVPGPSPPSLPAARARALAPPSAPAPPLISPPVLSQSHAPLLNAPPTLITNQSVCGPSPPPPAAPNPAPPGTACSPLSSRRRIDAHRRLRLPVRCVHASSTGGARRAPDEPRDRKGSCGTQRHIRYMRSLDARPFRPNAPGANK